MVAEKQWVAEEQGGFRKRRGCRDKLMTLVLLGQLKAVPGRGMFVSFIDFKKAYDELIREVVGVFEGDGNRRPGPSLSEGSIFRCEL